MITRLSKIARLPHEIREQLNHRLHDGKLSKNILPWVNSLPETQEVLAEHFGGKPITHQNLSEWRRAGYQDWLFHQQRLQWFSQMTEQSTDIEKHDGSPDTYETMGNIFLFEIGQAITIMKATQDPNQRCDRLQNLIREFTRLQNAYNFSRRVQLDFSKHRALYKPAYSGPPVSPVRPSLGAPASRRQETVAPSGTQNNTVLATHPNIGGASSPSAVALCQGGSSASRPQHETSAQENTKPEIPPASPNASTLKPLNSQTPTPERQRAGALPDAPRTPEAQAPRASVPDCGSPLPRSEINSFMSAKALATAETPKLPNSSTLPNSQPIPPLAPTSTQPQIPHSNIQPPAAPRPYQPHAIPIRGRRFVCIEG